MTESSDGDQFRIDIDDKGTLTVHGDIDMAGGPVLDAAIRQQERSGRPIVIDVHDVYFMDSSGLRALLAASRRATHRGEHLVLRSVGAEVMRLLQITVTTDHFVIESHRG